jgi:trimeric autotransporter adhesin
LPGLSWQGAGGTEAASIKLDGTSGATNTLVMSTFNGSSVVERLRILTDAGDGIQVTGNVGITNDLLTNNAKLKAIAESNSDTAVDVFVYDTRKDSDGGAWRKRTQNTSWYNEALNTSTRGARKEFPSVAVIVAESDTVTIYDGDDPDMPMWMVFTQATLGNLILGYGSTSSRPVHSIAMLDGTLVVSEQGSAGCLYKISMVADTSQWITENPAYGGFFKGDISTRNDGTGSSNYPSNVAGNPFKTIVSYLCNDVAMTVLPNAPIDADTGLPVPTIAVATNGGVSVIKDDGTVVDITAAAGSAYTGVSWIDITKNNYLIFEQDNSSNPRSIFHIPIPSSDRTTTTNDGVIDDKVIMKYYSNGAHLPYPCFNGGGVIEGIGLSKDNQALRSAYGDLTILEPNVADPEQGKVAYIASDYNTGWMHGDIKLATLSDTDTTNNPELITNGTFASNITGWSANNGATIVWNGSGDQTATVTSNGVNIWNGATQTLTGLVVGKTYILTADIITSSNWGSISFSAGANSGLKYGTYTSWNGGSAFPMKAKAQFTATETSVTVSIDNLNTTYATVTKVDNISVRLAAADRSVNNNALQTFGTVTKTAVATGADLVGYSGWSASNYLQQPYNSDLDFGTGDFSIAGWIKPVASSTVQTLLNRKKLDASGTPIEFGINSDETPYLYTGSGATPLSGKPLPVGTWLHIVAVRQGGFYGIYINGELFNSNTGQNVNNVSNTDAPMVIGAYMTNGGRQYPWQGSLALLRISATAPTAEQIAKMYNDEKHLFQTNAKATLYGSSDAVTALAYDDDTELLHVGTSAGRSVFQGLNRVDNTTDAVGTAISASNGLVAED